MKTYRGLHLNANNIDLGVVDQWIDQKPMALSDLEKLLNHIHLYDLFHEIQDECQLKAIANEIAHDWQITLSSIDPRYRVVEYEGYGPEITFYFERGTSSAV